MTPAIITLARASAICKQRLGFGIGKETWRYCAKKYPHLCATAVGKHGGFPHVAGIYESRWRNFLSARNEAKNSSDLLGDWVTL